MLELDASDVDVFGSVSMRDVFDRSMCFGMEGTLKMTVQEGGVYHLNRDSCCYFFISLI